VVNLKRKEGGQFAPESGGQYHRIFHYMPLLPALTKETKAAQNVKDKSILVITGNPPYAGHSKNPSEKYIMVVNNKGKSVKRKIKTWIGNLIDNYKFIDGYPLKEKNPKWLQDDYVKFIRFAQWKMEDEDEGVIGIITNHRFISNPTFKGMRKSLMNSFNQIYIFDLHGSHKPKEFDVNGGPDENVFDKIQQGVAISFFIKKPGLEKKIYHAEIFGTRIKKYEFCDNNDIGSVKWSLIEAESPHYLLLKSDKSQKKAYDKGISIKDIFEKNVIGFYTGRDDVAIASELVDLKKQVLAYNSKIVFDNNKIEKCLYRPFDYKYVYFTREVVNRPRSKVMPSMLKPNLGLAIGRAGSAVSQEFMWNLAFVSDKITDQNIFSRGGANIFPMYLYTDQDKSTNQHELSFEDDENKKENFSSSFRFLLHDKYSTELSTEIIFGYIYAILYTPFYRNKYKAFLIRDFPRIPFPEDIKIFKALSTIGWQIIDSQLMKKIPLKKNYPIGDFKGRGDNTVISRNFVPGINVGYGQLYINKTQFFDKIPINVYDFYIGGYQTLDKYLKDRQGLELKLKDIDVIEKMIRIICFVIDKMNDCDVLTKGWI
jgi:predicted helicase